MRILFVGDDWYGSNATSLRNGLAAEGHDVVTLDTFRLSNARRSLSRRILKRADPDGYQRRRVADVTRAGLALLRGETFDMTLVFKGSYVERHLVEQFPGLKVHYHPDDSANPHNSTPVYRAAESAYDLHVTTKRHNVAEVEARTGRPVQFVMCAYDPAWHYAPSGGPANFALGLVGTKRPDRVRFVVEMAREARRLQSVMQVHGSGWQVERDLTRIALVSGPRFGEDFSHAVHAAPIQLGVLNSDNRDTHTCRTFEIPAASGLFLGEMSDEHAEVFGVDGTGALLYSSTEEALDMAKYLMTHPDFANSVRWRGSEIVRRGANTYQDRAHEIIDRVAG